MASGGITEDKLKLCHRVAGRQDSFAKDQVNFLGVLGNAWEGNGVLLKVLSFFLVILT